MAEYAPEALKWLGAEIVKAIPSAEFSGIVGDPSHTYGYHRARSVLPSGDYSVQTSPDKQGDADAASALDIKFNVKWMKIITKRLMDSAKDQNDSRLNYMREFFGTLNGSTVAGWDTYYGRPATSDDSHLWHVHMSILRKYCTSKKHMAHILSVIKGEDMELSDRVKVAGWITDKWDDVEGSISVRTALGSSYGHARQAKDMIRDSVPEILAGQAAILEAIKGSDASEIQEAIRAEVSRANTRSAPIRPSTLADKLTPALVEALGERLGDDIERSDLTEAATAAVTAALEALEDSDN